MRTLYVRNLNDKIKPDGKSVWSESYRAVEMLHGLFHLFSQHGEVLEIRTKKGNAMRGQAFVTLREQEMADASLRALQKYPLFGKEMVRL